MGPPTGAQVLVTQVPTSETGGLEGPLDIGPVPAPTTRRAVPTRLPVADTLVVATDDFALLGSKPVSFSHLADPFRKVGDTHSPARPTPHKDISNSWSAHLIGPN